MPDRLTPLQIAAVMNEQRQIWIGWVGSAECGNVTGEQIITDCCHALANKLGLKDEHRSRFLRICGV